MSDRGPPPLRRDVCAYAAFYCEENAWHLVQREDLPAGARAVVFVSNPDRSVAMWGQRAADPGEPVIWDYHAFVAVQSDLQTWIYDLDTRLALPCEAGRYLEASFPFVDRLAPRFAPRFRVVPEDVLLARFSSDRTHMLEEEAYRAPPPPWPPIRPEGAPPSTLLRFLDPTDPIAGLRLDLEGFRAWCGAGRLPP